MQKKVLHLHYHDRFTIEGDPRVFHILRKHPDVEFFPIMVADEDGNQFEIEHEGYVTVLGHEEVEA